MSKSIGIIGGGIIGLSCAYYLQKAGHKVSVLDQGDMESGCSYGNAGMIVPSHFIPLAAPGMIQKGVRWMFNARSPFYIRPELDADLFRWGYQFYRHATKAHVERSIPALLELGRLSRYCFNDWAKIIPSDFGFREKGLLMLFQEKSVESEERETVQIANRLGMEATILSPSEVQSLEPEVQVNVRGGVYFPGDAHLTPELLMNSLKSYLQNSGVVFHPHCRLIDFICLDNQISALSTTTGGFSFDEIVLATGSWSGGIARKLDLTIPMQAGKGYSFTKHQPTGNIQIPSLLLESRVAMTPMDSQLRIGGTMEISGIDHTVNMNRVKGIVNAIPKYYPEMKVTVPDVSEVWSGLRPCSPDGLPFIGRLSKIKNLVMACGHSMMGVSLGPGTGKIVSAIISDGGAEIDLHPFRPARFME